MNFIENNTDYYFINQSIDEYLLSVRGPKHVPLNVAVPITIVYVMIFVTGVVGNIAVCVVIIRNVSLHTATNYYLFSLAVSDLTLLILGKFKYFNSFVFFNLRKFGSKPNFLGHMYS